MDTYKPKAVSTRLEISANRLSSGDNPQVITMITATVEVNQQISSEVIALCDDKEAIAKILNWDTFDRFNIESSDILKVETKGDILRFNLIGDRTIPISIDQLFYYWEQIQQMKPEVINAQEISHDEIVALAKEIGTEVWEHGIKLGYILQYRQDFYAVTSILTPIGFEYSYSRCGSFYLAHSELIERSWEVEAALEAA